LPNPTLWNHSHWFGTNDRANTLSELVIEQALRPLVNQGRAFSFGDDDTTPFVGQEWWVQTRGTRGENTDIAFHFDKEEVPFINSNQTIVVGGGPLFVHGYCHCVVLMFLWVFFKNPSPYRTPHPRRSHLPPDTTFACLNFLPQ